MLIDSPFEDRKQEYFNINGGESSESPTSSCAPTNPVAAQPVRPPCYILSSIAMEPITLTWWAWLIAGFVLMVAELLVPTGFFLFFFGVGAVVTALLARLGVLSSFNAQGLTFVGISLFCVVLLRKPLLAKFHFRNRVGSVDSLVGETAKALEAIAPQAIGKVEMRGSSWSALNTGSELIALNVRCRVEKVQGLTLHVRI
jgi:membrane protein implicated in regulation of membrane protease activity